MAQSTSARAKATKAKAKSVGSATKPTTNKTASGADYIPAEIGFAGSDEHEWLHHHTSACAYFQHAPRNLYDVWTVEDSQGQMERVLMASPDPLRTLDSEFGGNEISFITPHIEPQYLEHFLCVLYRMGECLKDYRDFRKAGNDTPLREPIMHALKGGAA